MSSFTVRHVGENFLKKNLDSILPKGKNYSITFTDALEEEYSVSIDGLTDKQNEDVSDMLQNLSCRQSMPEAQFFYKQKTHLFNDETEWKKLSLEKRLNLIRSILLNSLNG